MLPAAQGLGFQQMRVGTQETDSTLLNALSMAQMFSLNEAQAQKEIRRVVRAVNRWQEYFRSCGVTRGDIELCAEHIDRPFLRDQRTAV